jgi:DNA-directed RNA polymerase subunit M/transcription elongation factor TFIIS
MSLKIQCPACRELVELLDFSTSESGISFRCGACGQESFVRNPHAQNVVKPEGGATPKQQISDKDLAVVSDKKIPGGEVRSAEIICPKCGYGQDDHVACHRCGLTFAKYDPDALPPDPEAVVAAWATVQRQPLSDDAHEAFLQACLTANRLDFGARQYRRLARDPATRDKTEKMLARLFQVGQARLGAHADLSASQNRPTSRAKAMRWILFLAAAGLFSYFIMKLTDLLNML